MISTVLGALRWWVSLAVKFGRVVFWRTSLIVGITLVSQLSALLAFVLPLKVVILLGSDRIPRYIPDVLAAQGRESLIVLLSVATVSFFLLHLLAERLIATITTQATGKLLAESHKLVLFENQDEIAANAYQRFSRAVAGMVFSVLAMAGLSLLYPDLAWVLAGYSALAAVTLYALAALSESFRERLENRLQKTMVVTAGIGFFSAFAYLVADFILLEPPGVLTAIISLLLGRQFLNRLEGTVRDIATLHQHRVRIDALFFHEKVLLPQTREDKTIWPLLEPDGRQGWITAVLEQLVPDWKGYERLEWHPSGTVNVAAFMVTSKSHSVRFLVKLFEANRKSLALHESTLLSEPPKGLPAPMFLGSTYVERFICLVYSVPGTTVPRGQEARLLLRELRVRLLAVEPPVDITQRYLRSRPLLWHRLRPSFLRRMNLAVTSAEQKRLLSRFLELLPELQMHLKSLPLAIVNPKLVPVNVWREAQAGEAMLFEWGRWTLEPVGAKWPIGTGTHGAGDELDRLVQQLRAVSEIRPALAEVRAERVELAALASALEERCLQQRFDDGLELVGRILERLDALAEAQPGASRVPA